MIAYNEIYEAARKERYSEQLQPIQKNFVSEVSNYLKEKKDILQKEDDTFSDVVIKTKKQLENAITLFKELMLRRRKKILDLVLIAAETGISKQDFENMLLFEKRLFEELMKCVEKSDKEMNEVLSGKEEVTKKNNLIVFLESVEELILPSGEKIGPYDVGDVANLPIDIADIFVSDKKAEKVLQ
jgi:DNA replication initiation complex subunit (GINS family)